MIAGICIELGKKELQFLRNRRIRDGRAQHDFIEFFAIFRDDRFESGQGIEGVLDSCILFLVGVVDRVAGDFGQLLIQIGQGIGGGGVVPCELADFVAQFLDIVFGIFETFAVGTVCKGDDGADDVSIGIAVAGGMDFDMERIAVCPFCDCGTGYLVGFADEGAEDCERVVWLVEKDSEGTFEQFGCGWEAPDSRHGGVGVFDFGILVDDHDCIGGVLQGLVLGQ